jgi:cell division control protein 45
LHTLILLSLGSLLPLSSHFLPRFNPRVHIHVLDSHRPWNLENLFGGGLEGRERIWVWGDDERSARAMEKERKAFEALEVSASLSFLLLRSLCT